MLLFYYTQYMSQVIRKYDSGGKTEKPKLFSISGLGDFDQNALIERGYRDVDDYIYKKGLKGSMASNFRNAVQYMLEGINNGTLTMDAMGNFQDKTGRASSTGELDRKKFLGIKTGVKDTDNNAYGIAADYLHGLVMNSPKYKQPDKKIEKFNTNDYLTKEISKRWYSGNKIDFGNWFKNRSEQDRNALIGEIFSNADYNQLYNDYDWTDTGINSAEDLATRGKAFSAAISNNTLDNDDYNTFAVLGGSGLDKFLKEAPVQTEPTPEQSRMKAWEAEAEAAGATTPEAKSAYIQRKQREEADRNAAIVKANEEDIYNRERDAFFNDYATKNPFKGTVSGYVASKTSYNPENVLQYIDTTHKGVINDYLKSALDPRYFRGQLSHKNEQGQDNLREHLANNLDLAINTGKLPKIDDETYAIPGTYNYDNWSLITYNPVSRQYKETSMLANDALKKIAYAEYDRRKKTPTNKEGGVIKLQYGGFVEDDSAYNAYREQFAKKKEEKKQQIQAKAKATDRTPEQVEAGERKPMADGQDWEYEDYARLVSAGADVGSMIASFAPGYGTAASAALGLGSTIGNFTADLADESVGVGSAFLNAGAGLGMDLVGLIPGLGAAGKGSKIVKNLLKIAPKLATIWSASTSFAPAMQAFTKLKDKGAKEMTVEDWRALANGLTAAAGVTRWGAAAAKNKINTHKYGTTTRTVTTKSGKQVQMSEEEFQRIQKASGIEGQNKALQAVEGAKGEQLPTTFKKWYDIRRVYQGTPDVDKNTVINTDAMRRTAPDGTILEPTKFSNQGIWRGAVNNDWGYNRRGWKGPKWLKDWGYAPAKKEIDPKTVDEAIDAVSSIARTLHTASRFKPAPLALPAPGQTTPSNRVFYMGSSKPKVPQDVTNPSNLKKPGSYTDRAVPSGGTPVESPNANAVRTVRTINSILEPFVSQPRNLPAVIPASRNAKKVVASQTIQPTQRLDQFIESQIPGGRQFGRQRAKTEREYRDIFHPVAEREYNKVWDDMYEVGDGWMFPQAALNERAANVAMRGLISKRQAARDAAESVNRQIAMAVAQQVPRRLTRAEYNKRQGQLEATFNQKKYDMEEALRTRELPHKKSNKKKKTSKDNKVKRREFGGLLFKEGGLIPKYQGGNVMQRGTKGSWLNNENTYKDTTNLGEWDNYYDMNKIIDDVNTSGLLAQQNTDEFINTLNGLTSQNLPWKKQLNARGYKNWNQLYKTTGFNKYFGEDEGRFDYLGPSTWSRKLFLQTLGSRYNSPENALSVGNDKIWYGDGAWKKVEKALSEPEAEKKVEVVTGQKQAETPAVTGLRITLPDVTSKKFSIHPEDALALGRMVGGLVTNNRAAKLYKEGLKPTLLDTFENYVPLQGNFQAKTSGEQQAGNIQSLAAMPRTSDASLQLAGELDATDRAAQARMQGDLADAERFYQTRMLGQQESDAAKARRVEVANKNRAAINAIDAAKKQIDAGRVTANYQQVLAPWLAGVENQFRQNRAMKNQLALETYQNRASSEYDLALAKILEDYKDDPVGRQKALNQLRSEASADLLKERSKLIDSPWLIQFGEKGTKLTYKEKAMLQRAKDFNKRLADDNKQFHKDIMESKREHNKLIMNMSALTAALIKKGMQL